MTDRMTVHLDGKAIYDIVMTCGFDALEPEMERLQLQKHKVCIVSDTHVAPLYLQEVEDRVSPHTAYVSSFIFEAGEEQKNLDTVRALYEHLILEHFDRKDILIALGGGVVGDLCGFASATYLRGISFIQIPTTLLSQVDSSIGGKTGVDFDAYKNMVGAFHMPLLVYTNPQTLQTLPKEQLASGMGEILKHGLIKDLDYYCWLHDHADAIMKLSMPECMEMIRISDNIKRQVVEHDPTEQGERGLLNFGHTLGHAIEKLKNFQMLHGHCVALGCLAAAWISAMRGNISMQEVAKIRDLFESYQLPVHVSGLNAEDVIQATKNDKKMEAGKIKFILLKRIGEAYIDRTVTEEEMLAGLSYIMN